MAYLAKVYLDGSVIGSAYASQHKVISFDYHDGSKLVFKELKMSIIQINKFELEGKLILAKENLKSIS